LPDVKLSLIDHPSLKELGAKDVWEEYHKLGGKTLTSNGVFSFFSFSPENKWFADSSCVLVSLDWITRRSKLVGTKRVERLEREPEGVLDDIHFRHHPEYAKA